MNKTASERTGFLFDPGPSQKPIDLSAVYGDGTVLRVVRWKLLKGRPCLVRCDAGERNIVRIQLLKTLCGRECKKVDVTMTSSQMPSADDPLCETCLSLAGRGVLR